MTEAFVKACADKEALEQERGDSNQKRHWDFGVESVVGTFRTTDECPLLKVKRT